MPKNPHADFTPTLAGYSGITPFRFWCQTALPLTYDDSLSYYELLNKVVNYLNHTIEDLTNVENNTSELAEAYEQLQKYVNDYFDDIDIVAELRNVLDKMAEDGTLDALLDPLVENQLPGVVDEKIDGVVANQIDEAVGGQIDESVADQLPAIVEENVPGEVSEWLTENVNPVGSAVVVDSSLTISGAAADAKVTGDKVSDLKTQLSNHTDRLNAVDGKIFIDPAKFRIGNITITDSGWSYTNSNNRVSTIEGYTFALNVGDVIKLTDYTDAKFYLGWLTNGEYHTKSWNTSDYLVSQDGDYVINIAHITERSLEGNKNELLDLLVIEKGNYFEKGVLDNFNVAELNGVNFPIDGWSDNGYYKLSSSATSVDINAPVTGPGFKCIAVPCLPGDVFTITARGTATARPYAFLSSASGENNIVARAGSNDYAVENKKIIAPLGAVYAIFNADYSSPYKVIKGDLLKDKKTELDNPFIPWELGNIAFNGTDSPTYKVDRSSRVRTPEGFSIYLHAGDIIGMSDYTNAEFYAGWKDNNGVYHNTTVKTADYRIAQDGEYYFLLRNITEVNVSADISVLTNLFFIKMFVNTNQIYNESCKYNKQIVDKENGGMNYHLFKPCTPKFAMHRGYSTLAPENTVPAFELAGENGAWAIETDVYETTDGYFVCHHDSTVDRMTDGTGIISEMTLAQIEALTIDAGAHIEDYPNLKIPKFADYLSICRRYGCVCFVEIKAVNNYQSLMNVINEMGMKNSVVFLVSLTRLVPILRFYTKTPIAVLGYQNTVIGDMIDEIKSYYNAAIDVTNATITDDTDIIKAHKNNMPVFAWTVDTEQRADELFRLGVDVITSNSIPKLT